MKAYTITSAAIALLALFTACEKKETTPTPVDETPKPTELIDKTKGFHRIGRFFDGQLPSGGDIKCVDMTTQGNRLNVAFTFYNSAINIDVKRLSVDYTTGNELQAAETLSLTGTNKYTVDNSTCQYVPYTNTLVHYHWYQLPTGGYYLMNGDITEGSGQKTYLSKRARVGKYPHLIMNPTLFWDGYNDGAAYGCMVNGKFKTFTDYAGFLKNESFGDGIFEPINSSNEAVLITFHTDSVNLHIRDLNDTIRDKAVRKHSVTIPKSQNLFSLNTSTTKTYIKNNPNDNNFTFAIYGPDRQNREFYFWTYKYDHAAKTITPVVVFNSHYQNDYKAFDLDQDGNLYVAETNALFKVGVAGKERIYENMLLAGTISQIKHFNGKLFMAITHKNNTRQMDIVVQD